MEKQQLEIKTKWQAGKNDRMRRKNEGMTIEQITEKGKENAKKKYDAKIKQNDRMRRMKTGK